VLEHLSENGYGLPRETVLLVHHCGARELVEAFDHFSLAKEVDAELLPGLRILGGDLDAL
jgi:hypothetical protein